MAPFASSSLHSSPFLEIGRPANLPGFFLRRDRLNGTDMESERMGVSNPPHLLFFSRQSKQKSPLSGADEQGRSFPCIYSSSLARLRCVNPAAPPGSEFTQVSLCTFSHVCNSVLFCLVSYSPDSFHRRPAAASSILSSGGREPLVWRRKEKGLLSPLSSLLPSFLPSTSVGRRPIASFSPSERDGGLLWYPRGRPNHVLYPIRLPLTSMKFGLYCTIY